MRKHENNFAFKIVEAENHFSNKNFSALKNPSTLKKLKPLERSVAFVTR